MTMKLSGLREDTIALKRMSAVGSRGKDIAEERAQAPLLVLPAGFTNTQPTATSPELELCDLPHVFSLVVDPADSEMRAAVNLHCFIRNPVSGVNPDQFVEDDLKGLTVEVVLSYGPRDFSLYEVVLVDKEGSGFMAVIPKCLNIKTTTEKEHKPTFDPELITLAIEQLETYVVIEEEIRNTARAALGLACGMSYFAKTNGKYPVVVRGSKPCKAKKVYKRKGLPRLIYMNALPRSEPKPHQGGSHASPMRHQRKGHYKTLKSERFKKHPLYGVEKGVFVRAAWVGSKEVVHEGNRYTVIV